MEVELTKARAEAAEAKRQLELQRAAQPKARTQVKAPDEPKPSAQPAAIAHAPVKVEPIAAKPAAPEQKGFLPRWLWSSSPQKNP